LFYFYRQYYTYVTDKRCKRLGSQAWVFVCITLSELILNIKFGLDLFSHTQLSMMVLWVSLTLLTSVVGMIVSMKIYKRRYPAKPEDNPAVPAANVLDSPSRNTRSSKGE
jgi:phosphatidylserine synthase 1